MHGERGGTGEKNEVFRRDSQSLQSFFIFLRLVSCGTVQNTPIISADDRHGVEGEEFFDFGKSRDVSAATRDGESHRRLSSEGTGSGIKKASHRAFQRATRPRIMHRCTEDESVRFFGKGGKGVDAVFKKATSRLPAQSAGNAGENRRISEPEGFGSDVRILCDRTEFLQRTVGDSMLVRRAVDQKNFHIFAFPFLTIPKKGTIIYIK